LILLFLYLGVIALRNAIDDPRRADRACAILSIVGAINVPIIYYSVKWWNTLHQGASVRPGESKMATIMLMGMLIMSLAAWFYAIAVVLARVRVIIIERERGSAWVAETLRTES
jgi:ABC-type transport system involved in cytochrome c biogenesis, permease component